MKIVDARSGEVMKIGTKVSYPGGEFIRLLRVDGERALLERAYSDVGKPGSPLVEDTAWAPLIVRRGDHPSFPGQVVGFIPS